MLNRNYLFPQKLQGFLLNEPLEPLLLILLLHTVNKPDSLSPVNTYALQKEYHQCCLSVTY